MSTIAFGPGVASPRTSARRPAGPARPARQARPARTMTARVPQQRRTPQVQQAAVAAPTGVRLTRRGRLVLFLGFVVVALAAFIALGAQSAATGEAGEPVPTRTIVVTEGQTLWGIASEIAEPGQVRETIHQIEELNALPGAALAEGQTLAVPVG